MVSIAYIFRAQEVASIDNTLTSVVSMLNQRVWKSVCFTQLIYVVKREPPCDQNPPCDSERKTSCKVSFHSSRSAMMNVPITNLSSTKAVSKSYLSRYLAMKSTHQQVYLSVKELLFLFSRLLPYLHELSARRDPYVNVCVSWERSEVKKPSELICVFNSLHH